MMDKFGVEWHIVNEADAQEILRVWECEKEEPKGMYNETVR